MNNPELYTSPIIDELFDQITPEELDNTTKKMLLSVKLADVIKAKGLKKSELAARLGKRPSEITKWLSGTHNFTYDTICDLERALDINLINLEMPKKEIHVFCYNIEVDQKQTPLTNPFPYESSLDSIGTYSFNAYQSQAEA